MKLIPDGWMLTRLFQFKDCETAAPFGWGCTLNIDGDYEMGYWWFEQGETPALAMCCAAISAHKTMNETSRLVA